MEHLLLDRTMSGFIPLQADALRKGARDLSRSCGIFTSQVHPSVDTLGSQRRFQL
jgi:hypothetical protein